MHPARNPAGLPPCSPAPGKARGFTLIELVVTIAIAAILGTLAAPSFKGTLDRWRVNQAKQAFSSSLFLARSEAIRRGDYVLLANKCSSGGNWDCGWEACIPNTKASTSCSDSPEILQDIPATYSTHASASGNYDFYRFNRWGHTDGLSTLSVVFYPESAASAAVATVKSTLCMSSGGRIKFVDAANCS